MKQSQLLIPTRKEAPAGEESKNAIILMRGGYVDKLMAGVYSYLPLGLRVLKKIQTIVREEMNKLPNTQEVLMPVLQPKELWMETGRWEEAIGDVMYTLADDTMGLGPTHEEIVTDLFRRYVSSYKEVPLGLYQIQSKFRKELRAKSGLLRGREFMMKDLYSFHTTEEDFLDYYAKAKDAYLAIYNRCGLDALYTEAAGGMFSNFSHEFQVITEAGEDTIYLSADGKTARNEEIVPDSSAPELAEFAGGEVRTAHAVEVGNIFPLAHKYSKPMNASVLLENGDRTEVWMGCYGIGISRLIGTVVEVHGTKEGRMQWPKELAPFLVHIVDLSADGQAQKLHDELEAAGIEVLLDDREVSAGQKFAESDLIGSPYRIVVSKRAAEQGGVELRTGDTTEIISVDSVRSRIQL